MRIVRRTPTKEIEVMVTNEEDFAAGDDTCTEISLGLKYSLSVPSKERTSPRANRLLNEQIASVADLVTRLRW